jgi:inhibitor of the pro-sigma K processing machinery
VEWKVILLSVIGLIGLFLVVTLLIRPFKLLLHLTLCFVVGGVLLYLTNFLLQYVGMHIALNPVTMLTAGILQVPGVVLLVLLSYLI